MKNFELLKKFYAKHPYWMVFLTSALIGMLMIMPTIFMGEGIFTFIDDYNAQQIPFNIAMNEAFQEGGATWNWYNDLGASFVGSYGLYNIYSPFVMILWIFPTFLVPYLMGPIFILKYAVAGLTAFMFLKRHVKESKWAFLGALLYAFSGFQITNTLFYHFHDVVAFFPLLLYGLDRLAVDKKKWIFLVVVALNLLTNYYFFIGQVMFVLIYYVVMLVTRQYKWSWRSFIQIVIESVLGVSLVAFLLIPSLLFVMGNPRVSNGWGIRDMLLYRPGLYAKITKGLFAPNESMTFRALFSNTDYKSIETYLPLVGVILWFSYLVRKPKDWASVLMFILFVFMFVPIFNSTFFALTTAFYARWYYMPILITALLSAKALDEKVNLLPGFLMSAIAIVGLCGIMVVANSFIIRKASFLGILAFMIVSMIAMAIIMFYRKHLFIWLLLGVVMYVVLYGNNFIFYNKALRSALSYQETTKSQSDALSDLDDSARYNVWGCAWNIGVISNRMIVNSWNSNDEPSVFKFYKGIELSRGVGVSTPITNKKLQSFLSVKGIISCHEDDALEKIYGTPEKLDRNEMYLYNNDDYAPIGQKYNYYISAEEFARHSQEEKIDILNHAVVLNDEQIEKYAGVLLKEYKVGLKSEMKNQENSFRPLNDGFDSEFDIDKDSLMVYTVPYSKGWVASRDGEEIEVEEVDNGMIAVVAPKGYNKIQFRYEAPGQKIGMIISIFGLVGLIVYGILYRKEKR